MNMYTLRSYIRKPHLLVILLLVASLTSGLVAQPDRSAPCFNRVLQDDPVNCHALTKAQAQGVLDIDKIYNDNGVLYVSLTDSELDDDMRVAIKKAAGEYYDKNRLPASYDGLMSYCVAHTTGHVVGDRFRSCFIDDTFVPGMWDNVHGEMPPSPVYLDIVLLVGGEERRRQYPGWASWIEVWPQAEQPRGASSFTGPFDISGIDMTVQPVCCGTLYEKYPDLGLAGWFDLDATYVQVKHPPKDEAKFEAAKEAFSENWDAPVVFVPVPVDQVDLHRGAVLLNRFAKSAGNTIGISAAYLTFNGDNGLPSSIWRIESTDDYRDPLRRRDIIAVESHNPHLTATGLPTLLQQLSIPSEAVGVIEFVSRGGRAYDLILESDSVELASGNEDWFVVPEPYLISGIFSMAAMSMVVTLIFVVLSRGTRRQQETAAPTGN